MVVAGCAAPTYRFEQRPGGSATRGCYESARVELASGRMTWRFRADTGHTVSGGPSSGYTMTYGPPTLQSADAVGLIAYAGGRRLDAVGALRRLGDARLLADHQRRLAETASAGRWFPIYRKATIGAAAVGIPLAVTGSVLLAVTDSDAAAYTLIGGLGFLIAAGLAHVGSLLTGPDYARHQRDRELLVHPPAYRRAAAVALEHNRRVAARCGATADLPATDRARELLQLSHSR